MNTRFSDPVRAEDPNSNLDSNAALIELNHLVRALDLSPPLPARQCGRFWALDATFWPSVADPPALELMLSISPRFDQGATGAAEAEPRSPLRLLTEWDRLSWQLRRHVESSGEETAHGPAQRAAGTMWFRHIVPGQCYRLHRLDDVTAVAADGLSAALAQGMAASDGPVWGSAVATDPATLGDPTATLLPADTSHGDFIADIEISSPSHQHSRLVVRSLRHPEATVRCWIDGEPVEVRLRRGVGIAPLQEAHAEFNGWLRDFSFDDPLA